MRATPTEYFGTQANNSSDFKLAAMTLGIVAIVGIVIAAIVLGRRK